MATPKVSIILPTYNRASFLPQALASIRSQTFTDWELIVVDDGSTDETATMLPELCRGIEQPTRTIRQANQGAYGARNTGLDHARARYTAFYDSDDTWLPHHLHACVAALEANSEVDWVYSATRLVDHASGKTLDPNSFSFKGQPRPFLSLHARAMGPLKIIDDSGAVECAILRGLYAGLQVSVIRRHLFDDYRFEATRRDEAEDQYLVIRALVAGRRLAYLDDVHVIYCVHENNSSASGTHSLEKHLRLFQTLAEGYEDLGKQLPLTPAQRRALNRRLSREYFWHLGYMLLQHPGHETQALAFLRRGLGLWPTNLALWKTYLASWLRVTTGLGRLALSRPTGSVS